MTQFFDPNMEAARRLAEGLGRPPKLPSALQNVKRRARLVDAIDGPLIEGGTPAENIESLRRRISEMAATTKQHMPEVDDPLVRVNIALRLWSGCLSAAKTIALETLSGPNTTEKRQEVFAKLDAIAQSDPIFKAGMEAAPDFKKCRGEQVSYDGVPDSSPVRKFAET